MKYIHIGLGKTGTTFLQNYIFEIISKYENLIYYNSNHPGSKLVRNHSIKLRTNEEISDIKLPDNVFVSDETLVSWDPQDWENFAAKNLIAFGSNCAIILTIREPRSFFNSLYSEICLQSSKVKSLDEFIYCKKQIDLKRSPSSLNIYDFSYNKLINIYKKIFHKIIIIKYEDITNLAFIDKYFSKTSINILEEIQYTKTFKINKSYSMYAEVLHLFLFNNMAKFIFI
ncbi:hypothetical protein OAI62_00355 [Pelagibacteraceae bacterium]|nr:hypothetical protein [Pelagibacteraceae bacterium]